jgi:hypothetical protein
MAVADDDLVAGVVHKPVGFAQYTGLDPAINLESDPATGKKLSECNGKPIRALIQAEAQGIRWTDDPDHDPTTALGMVIAAGDTLVYEGDLSKIRLFDDTAGAIANISYYGL